MAEDDFVTIVRELDWKTLEESRIDAYQILSTNVTDLYNEIRDSTPAEHDTLRLVLTSYKSPVADE